MHCFDLIDSVCDQLDRIAQTSDNDKRDESLAIALTQLCTAFSDLQGNSAIRHSIAEDPEVLQDAFGGTAEKRVSFASLVSIRNIELIGRSLDYAGWRPPPAQSRLEIYVQSMKSVWSDRAGIPSGILLQEMADKTGPIKDQICGVAHDFASVKRKKITNDNLRRGAFKVVALGVATLGLAGTIVGLTVDLTEFEQQVERVIPTVDVQDLENFLSSALVPQLTRETREFGAAALLVRSAQVGRPRPSRGGPTRRRPPGNPGVPPRGL